MRYNKKTYYIYFCKKLLLLRHFIYFLFVTKSFVYSLNHSFKSFAWRNKMNTYRTLRI